MRSHFIPVFWIVVLWWTAYALMFATQVVSMGEQQGSPVSWSEALRFSFGGWLTWIPLSLGLYALVLRFPLERGRVLRSMPILALGVLVVVLFRAVYVYTTNTVFEWYPVLPDFWTVLLASMRNNLMLGFTVVGVAHALVFYRQARARAQRVAELETHLAKSRLDALRAQLHPHFLFNALNSVAEMVHKDADVADRMLVSLSALLRNGLSTDHSQLRPLGAEVELVRHYLMIERIRLGDRLQIDWHVDDQCLAIPVPTLVLQPLVENAIVHGISRRREPGWIRILARQQGENLVLVVENSVGTAQSTKEGTGIGQRSIADRLRLLYAESAVLARRNAGAGVYAIEVRIPVMPDAGRALNREASP
jgi:uncharacterized membrane-anchored protein YhcB (DUF1043 family)